jgi:hypothetical protein
MMNMFRRVLSLGGWSQPRRAGGASESVLLLGHTSVLASGPITPAVGDVAQCPLVGADSGNASILSTELGASHGDRVARPEIARAKGHSVPEGGELSLSDAAQEAGTAALEALGLVLEDVSGAVNACSSALLSGVTQITGRTADLSGWCQDVGRTVISGAITLLLGVAVTSTGVADCGSRLLSISRAVIACTSAELLLQTSHTLPKH